MKNKIIVVICFFGLASCSSFLNYKKESALFKNAEFEKKVVIVEAEEPKEEAVEGPSTDANQQVVEKKSENKPEQQAETKSKKEKSKPSLNTDQKNKQQAAVSTQNTQPKNTTTGVKQVSKNKKQETQAAPQVVPLRREPEIESDEGFVGASRRPPVDPFWVGETVVHDVAYLGASAGTLTLKVNPFAVVNGRKSYNFFIDLKSNSFFSNIYAIDDQVQTFVDYEELVPHAFKLNIRDSGQVKEAQSYFDNKTLRADYWEHRYTEKSGHEEKKQSWAILPYSQNPFSAIFYMRIFKFTDNKEYVFRVADDEKNVLFKAQVVGRSKLKTRAGSFNAIKLKAEIYSRGNLAKARDFFLWLSDDDRKYILRIEVKLPIGSLVSEATSIKEGRP